MHRQSTVIGRRVHQHLVHVIETNRLSLLSSFPLRVAHVAKDDLLSLFWRELLTAL